MRFATARPVTGQRFFNRKQSLDLLQREASAFASGESPRWFSMFGPRKSGKTSLLLEFFRRISGSLLCVRVDCWRVRANASELFWQLGVSLLDAYLVRENLTRTIGLLGAARTPSAIAELTGAARGRVDPVVLQGLTMLNDLAREARGPGLWDGLINLPQHLAQSLGIPVTVMFDEFQELSHLTRPRSGGLSGEDLYALLRSRWQTHEGVMYIVAGSRMTALRKLLLDRDAPFFQHFTPIEVGPFTPDDARLLLRTHFKGSGITASTERIDEIIAAVGTLPFYLQVVGAAIVDLQPAGDLTPTDVRRGIDRCICQPDGVLNLFFRNLFDKVVGRSGSLARTLLSLPEPAELGEVVKRVGVASGAVATYLRRLMNEDLVVKDDTGRYRIADRCFLLWLLSQEDLGGRPSPFLIGDASERAVTSELVALGFRVIYQSRGSRGAFDLLGLLGGHEFAIQVKTGDPPLRLPATQIRRMQHEARQMGWIPVLATVEKEIRFFDLRAASPGRKRSVVFGDTIDPIEDIHSLIGSNAADPP